jgi:hypothetical protein
MVLGFHRASLQRWFETRCRPGVLEVLLLLFIVQFAALIWLYRVDGDALNATWFDKASLPAPRLAACALTFGLAWLLVSRF